jgi:hypothetical protein
MAVRIKKLALAIGATVACLSPVASAQQTTTVEYNERASAERETSIRPNRPLLITGGALMVAPYFAGAIVAAQSDLDADHKLYIPLVGPWLDLGERPCAFGSDCSTGDNIASTLLIGSGVAQGVGLILATTSLFVPEKKVERTAKVHVVPVSFRGGGGIGATGTF